MPTSGVRSVTDFGDLNVSNSTFENNTAGAGGGIAAFDSAVTITNSTFDDNVADGDTGPGGGGILEETSVLSVTNSTFYDNHAGVGNAIRAFNLQRNSSAIATITSSTFTDGEITPEGTAIATGGSPTQPIKVRVSADIFDERCDQSDADWTDLGHNAATTDATSDGESCLVSDEPASPESLRSHVTPLSNGDVVDDLVGGDNLGELADNGGPTQTVMPQDGNQAIGAIPSPTSNANAVQLCPRTDQRGVASTGDCTIGAVEFTSGGDGAGGGDGGGGGGDGGGGGGTPVPPGTIVHLTVDPVGSAPAGSTITLTATVEGQAASSARPRVAHTTPTGTVTFSADGTTLCPAVKLQPDRTAQCATSSLTEGTHDLSAAYSGDANTSPGTGLATYEITAANSGGGDQLPPTIKAHVHSKHHEHHRWYRSPVHITFTCTAGDAPLAGPCPGPVVLRHNGRHRTVTRSISDTAGRSASVTVIVNIDRTKPGLTVDGVTDGKTYHDKPKLTCNATDALSGVASCHIHRHHHTHADGTKTYAT